jgi:hypothetical protein
MQRRKGRLSVQPHDREAIEAGVQRQLTDSHADLVVLDRVLGAVIEYQVAKMGVGVETAQVGVE